MSWKMSVVHFHLLKNCLIFGIFWQGVLNTCILFIFIFCVFLWLLDREEWKVRHSFSLNPVVREALDSQDWLSFPKAWATEVIHLRLDWIPCPWQRKAILKEGDGQQKKGFCTWHFEEEPKLIEQHLALAKLRWPDQSVLHKRPWDICSSRRGRRLSPKGPETEVQLPLHQPQQLPVLGYTNTCMKHAKWRHPLPKGKYITLPNILAAVCFLLNTPASSPPLSFVERQHPPLT